uniref:E3 ubiquitin-protein ligase makorin-2 n=1 Tax=Hippocampus comes TaxID=109280 RepID=A0A3Q2Z039_HIPCM
MSTKQVTCRYFLHGVCREGSRCMFSHDPSSSKPSTICKFYQRGVCAYGERCRSPPRKPQLSLNMIYAHDKIEGKSTIPHSCVCVCVYVCDSVGQLESVFGGAAVSLGSEVPAVSPHSYVDAIRTGLEASDFSQLCPYAAAGRCFYEDRCPYLHGDQCEVCRLRVLHPHDAEQRRAHEKMCLLAFERDMEKAFAAQLSQDKVCSICMEVVVQKAIPSERRFGILSSCRHIFCLGCIRQWRCKRNFSNKIIKSCPECRVVSEFVIPSVYWVEEQEEKDNLIELFKSGVSKKACKYFDQGRGSCPFGGKCLYLHAFPDGSRAEPEKPRKQLSSEGNIRFMNSVRLWDFIEEREQNPGGRPLPSLDDDMAELRELFMQMSAPEPGAV